MEVKTCKLLLELSIVQFSVFSLALAFKLASETDMVLTTKHFSENIPLLCF